ncbi:LOW QUALITY PROTEIN: nucleolar and spindle-associated protein 1 [Gymnodraco acuticeps]|uniref:LOW QUALITY PROTEIN: nucleolar and spindle-associated protein 1 n=1 Tax=Gymnodraco acuticeps TaxID=8218 RepID=A0A6P8SU30_GYMAC|nr:LOW QUALITY PROTEIN: nucleolar and spindle-associated protein 1 [Gymnodraco acuticeps]
MFNRQLLHTSFRNLTCVLGFLLYYGIEYNKNMDLDSMKYAELRITAKELGLKGNMKAEKLLKAIKQHYRQEKDKEEEVQEQEKDVAAAAEEDEAVTQDSVQDDEESACEEEVPCPTVFVNTRRGKGNGNQEKTRVDTDVASSAAPCGARGAKKRKVSSAKDSEQSETAPPQEPQTSEEKAPKVAKVGKIPRLQAKKKLMLNPVTPNFKKLHEANFSKMESIDSYVQRKNKQTESLRSSSKELKTLSDKTIPQQVDAKTKVKASESRASMFSPILPNKKPAEDKRRNTVLSASKAKAAGKEAALFRPSVLSTRRINVRFSEATRDNENKKSLVKTPARRTLCVTSSTPKKPTTAEERSPKPARLSLPQNTSGAFVFTGNTSALVTPGNQKKPTFDLKASLSRALAYKPHSGKLKPLGDANENPAANKSLISNSHQKNYKQHQVQTRGDRRGKHEEGRKQKKENLLGARRGLVMM